MTLDWTVPLGTVMLLAVQFIVGLVAILRALRSNERSIDARFTEMKLMLIKFEEGDLRELKTSVLRLTTGQDEWTKTLRERTHELANVVNDLLLRVDRLERPERYGRRKDDDARRKDDDA